MWAFNRPAGGRGVGFTGGHYHLNFADANFRKLVLNAIVWIAGVEVPASGVDLPVTTEELNERTDPKPRRARNGDSRDQEGPPFSQLLQKNIPELDLHWRADMDLEAQKTCQ
jgi:hypothetical protein